MGHDIYCQYPSRKCICHCAETNNLPPTLTDTQIAELHRARKGLEVNNPPETVKLDEPEAFAASTWLGRIVLFIRNYGWSFYLGGALAALGYSFLAWQYWAVLVPICVLHALRPNDSSSATTRANQTQPEKMQP